MKFSFFKKFPIFPHFSIHFITGWATSLLNRFFKFVLSILLHKIHYDYISQQNNISTKVCLWIIKILSNLLR